jgi:hypothetical protein
MIKEGRDLNYIQANTLGDFGYKNYENFKLLKSWYDESLPSTNALMVGLQQWKVI